MGSIKRTVQSAFLDAGLTLEKEALNAYVTFVEDNQGGEELVYKLLDASTKGISSCVVMYRHHHRFCSALYVVED